MSQSGWKGETRRVREGETLEDLDADEAKVRIASGFSSNNEATHCCLISKDERVVAGAYLKVSEKECFVLFHTAFDGESGIDYESYLVANIIKNFKKTHEGAPRVLGLFRVKSKPGEDTNDEWLRCQMVVKLRGDYVFNEDSRRTARDKVNKELTELYNDTGIQMLWFGEFVTFHYWVPKCGGYTRPVRQPNRAELANIDKAVVNIKHREGVNIKIDALKHQVALWNVYISKLEDVKANRPLRKDLPRTPKAKPKPKPEAVRRRSRRPRRHESSSDSDDDDSDDDDGDSDDGDSDDGDSDDGDSDDGDSDDGDSDDGGVNGDLTTQEIMNDDEERFRWDDDEDTVNVTPNVKSKHRHKHKSKSKAKKVSTRAHKKKKHMKKKRLEKFDKQ
jgi:hypothetical protein